MLPSASNATLPTARTNLGAWPQVSATKDLGFVGDGVTDNSAKLATLFAFTTSPTVYFDPGIYMIGCPTSQSAASNISLIGAGIGATTSGGSNTGGTVLRFSAGCAIPNSSVFLWQALSGFFITGYGVEVAHLTLDANFATRTGAIACIFCFLSDTDYSIHDVAIINWGTDVGAVLAQSAGSVSQRFTIRNNYFLAYNTVTAATVAAGGSGGTNGACTITGTTGTGTLFQASGTVTAGALGGALTITRAGQYTAQPGIPAAGSAPAAEPVTGCNLTGATVNLTTSLQSQNQAVTVSNVSGGVGDVWIRDNTIVNSGLDIDAHDLYVQNNDISGWAFGAAITTEATTNAHDLLIDSNDLHDSFMGLDSGGYAVGGIESWGPPDTKIMGNVCRNTFGTCLDGPGARGLVVGNRAYGVGKRGLASNTCAFASRFLNSTYNSNGAMYVGNYANDDGSLTLKYGFCDQSASVSGIILQVNSFSGANTPLNILGSNPVIDAQSQALKSATSISLDANGKQVAWPTLTSNALLTGGGAGAVPNAVAVTGLVKGNGASAPAAYGGTSCTNQFPRSLDANGAATCASVANADLAGSIAASKLLARANTQTNVSAPTGTTNTTGLMMGLNGALTPTFSGNILLIISGDISSNTTGDGAKVQASFGTGTAPINGAAITGTQCGGRPTFTALTGLLTVPFSINCMITGQALGTALWLDVTLAAITGGTATISNVSVSATEE